jgi:hypothetical protein
VATIHPLDLEVIMGTRVVDTATGNVLASAAGAYWTDDVGSVLDNQTKTDRADRLIMRAKQSADSVNKAERVLAGRKTEHGKILAALAGTLPAGMAVAFDDNGVPTGLVPAEQAPDVADESAMDSVTVPNRFDAIALAEAAK